MSDSLISRLHRANPAPLTHVSDDRLRERILASTPAWASTPPTNPALACRRRVQRWVASSAAAAAALAAMLVISLSGSTPNVAQAFPILKGSSTITPSELRSSLTSYGVAPNSDGLDVAHGHAVNTRWGTGYVLTNPRETAICIVAPGLRSDGWGASCASRSQAATAISQRRGRDENGPRRHRAPRQASQRSPCHQRQSPRADHDHHRPSHHDRSRCSPGRASDLRHGERIINRDVDYGYRHAHQHNPVTRR